MTVDLLVITDGRDNHLDATVASAEATLGGQIAQRWMYDDTGKPDHVGQLERRYPHYRVLSYGARRRGFGGAIGFMWQVLAAQSTAEHIFHLEDDFTFNGPADLAAMATVLEARPYLAQMALRRQAWNPAERAAGGVVEQHPDDYVDMVWRGYWWLQHTRFFTTNPCLYRRALCEVGWPDRPQSEGHFGIGLRTAGLPWGVAGPDVRFGFWGRRSDAPAVEHIGLARNGEGY